MIISRKHARKSRKNGSGACQNRVPELPKLSPEPSETQFLKDIWFKKAQEGLRGRPPQFFSAKKANLASSWRSKNVQNQGQNLKKSILTDDNLWHRFLKGADVVFEWFLVRFLDGQMHQNCKNMNLAKSLKIVILPR